MKYYAVLKETDLYKRNGGKFDLLYEIPEDFKYKLCFDNLEEGKYNIINEEYSFDEISKHIPSIY